MVLKRQSRDEKEEKRFVASAHQSVGAYGRDRLSSDQLELLCGSELASRSLSNTMDPEDLNNINQLLDHDVELREVIYPLNKAEKKFIIDRDLPGRESKTRSPSSTKKRARWLVC